MVNQLNKIIENRERLVVCLYIRYSFLNNYFNSDFSNFCGAPDFSKIGQWDPGITGWNQLNEKKTLSLNNNFTFKSQLCNYIVMELLLKISSIIETVEQFC